MLRLPALACALDGGLSIACWPLCIEARPQGTGKGRESVFCCEGGGASLPLYAAILVLFVQCRRTSRPFGFVTSIIGLIPLLLIGLG